MYVQEGKPPTEPSDAKRNAGASLKHIVLHSAFWRSKDFAARWATKKQGERPLRADYQAFRIRLAQFLRRMDSAVRLNR